MNRKQEFEKVKALIKTYYNHGDCGLYNSRNIVGDYIVNIFDGEYFQLDICYNYSYFEVFGTAEEEFKHLKDLYESFRV